MLRIVLNINIILTNLRFMKIEYIRNQLWKIS